MLAGRVSLVEGDEVLRPGADQGDLDRRQAALDPHQPRGRALHRTGRAGRVHPGGARGAQAGRRGDRDVQARPGGAAGRRERQRRDDEAARRRSSTSTTRRPGRSGSGATVADADEMALDTRSTKTVRVGTGAAMSATLPERPRLRDRRTTATSAGRRSPPRRRRPTRRSCRGRRRARHLARPPAASPARRATRRARATIATARRAVTTSSRPPPGRRPPGRPSSPPTGRSSTACAVAGVTFPADYVERRFPLTGARTGSAAAAAAPGEDRPEIDLAGPPEDPAISRRARRARAPGRRRLRGARPRVHERHDRQRRSGARSADARRRSADRRRPHPPRRVDDDHRAPHVRRRQLPRSINREHG